ncbi:fungal protein [Schizosaccharomyces japonicus yFS275]|uniref:Fungal protein n=1 Tax=Schizosaccharomyces japonicus (strain yFS275 / FY16936) TaxID=402676 RepID=B6JYB7_SCHJY|nr:fungal protein [Schizosaccharomyces japonicus yFS275]EEB06535.1 fungal protein [Schizosaccharomyces japonicus yFS275]
MYDSEYYEKTGKCTRADEGVVFNGTGNVAGNWTYNATGSYSNQSMPANYTPAGGVAPMEPNPVYHPLSDFDYQSLTLALYHEYIELDLFNWGLTAFSQQEFQQAGINEDYQHLIRFMAQQEIGHAELISNMLGPSAPKACTYNFNFTSVGEYLTFAQHLTKWSESGVYGFLAHMNSGAAATLLLQSISTEARQEMSLRQLGGMFPYPVWFETGIPQSFAWSLIAPYIVSCPANNSRVAWQNFPKLSIVSPNFVSNASNGSYPRFQNGTYMYPAAVSTNRTSMTVPGQSVSFIWETPGHGVGPNSSYVTTTSASQPRYAAWISQLNVTYTPLNMTGNSSGVAMHPSAYVFPNATQQVVNGTAFVVLVDEAIPLTPYNLSIINEHVVAGPAVYSSD